MKYLVIFIWIILAGRLLAQSPSPNIHEFSAGPEYLNTKNFFYDNGEEVIVFDAQLSPALAKKSIAYIQTKTKSPITWVVVLQPGVFQFNGISAFQEIGAKIIASRQTVDAMQAEYDLQKKHFLEGAGKSVGFAELSWPELPRIDSVFEGSHVLELKNGQTIVLKELSKPGASAHHTVAYIVEEEAVFVSDLIHYQTHAWWAGHPINGRNIVTIQSWLDNLNELNKIFKRDTEITIYASRGKLVNLPTAVFEQTRYLKAAYPIIINYVSANRSNWQGTNIPEKQYREFQTEMEQAFPSLAMPELVRRALLACWTCPGAEKPK
jgi:glyoxylase-like metal-dependent hydrolase (beta-lactamase superfamily II)